MSEAAFEVGARRHVGSRGLKEKPDISGVEKSGIFRSQKKMLSSVGIAKMGRQRREGEASGG